MRADDPSIFMGGSRPTRKRVWPALTSSDTAELRKNCVSVRGMAALCSLRYLFRAAFSLSASAFANRAVGSRAGSGFEGAAMGAAGSCVALGGGASGVAVGIASGADAWAAFNEQSVKGIMPQFLQAQQIRCRRTAAAAIHVGRRSAPESCAPQ